MASPGAETVHEFTRRRQWRAIILLGSVSAMYAYGYAQGPETNFAVLLLLCAPSLVYEFVFVRCPACNARASRQASELCYSCGARIRSDKRKLFW
jgi:hypothetical protein